MAFYCYACLLHPTVSAVSEAAFSPNENQQLSDGKHSGTHKLRMFHSNYNTFFGWTLFGAIENILFHIATWGVAVPWCRAGGVLLVAWEVVDRVRFSCLCFASGEKAFPKFSTAAVQQDQPVTPSIDIPWIWGCSGTSPRWQVSGFSLPEGISWWQI